MDCADGWSSLLFRQGVHIGLDRFRRFCRFSFPQMPTLAKARSIDVARLHGFVFGSSVGCKAECPLPPGGACTGMETPWTAVPAPAKGLPTAFPHRRVAPGKPAFHRPRSLEFSSGLRPITCSDRSGFCKIPFSIRAVASSAITWGQNWGQQ